MSQYQRQLRTMVLLASVFAAACDRSATAPIGPQVVGGASYDAAARIVTSGVIASAADGIALQYALRGDSSYVRELERGRRLHVATLDTVLQGATNAANRRGQPSFVQVASGEDVFLDESTLGIAQVYNATTAISFSNNGTTGNVTGQVSYRGTSTTVTVRFSSENLVGSRGAISQTDDEAEKSHNTNDQVNCIVTHTNNPSVCGTASYSEHSVSGLPIGQPCGTKLTGRTTAKAHWSFSLIGQVIDIVASQIKWKFSVPNATSPLFVEPDKHSTNATCIAPVVKAVFAGTASPTSATTYTASIPISASTASVSLVAQLLNTPLPAVTKYLLTLDGSEIAHENGLASVEVGPGTHTLVVTATDELLGQVGTASATLTVACAAAGEGQTSRIGTFGDHRSEAAFALPGHRVQSTSMPYCGENFGSPGGGAGNPPGEPGPNCEWARYFVVYTDGSWSWAGGWVRECEGDEMLRIPADSLGRVRSLSASKIVDGSEAAERPRTLQVRLWGGGQNRSGRPVELYRYPDQDSDVQINVDTTQASAADIETALALTEFIEAVDTDGIVGGVTARPTLATQAKSGSSSRSDKLLKDLKRAGANHSSTRGSGRTLKIALDRRGVIPRRLR